MLYSHKTFQTIAGDTENVSTDCNCVSFENRGDVACYLQAGDSLLEILSGEVVIWNCLFIDVLEVTFFNRIYFSQAAGNKKLFITREYIGAEKPNRPLENKHIIE